MRKLRIWLLLLAASLLLSGCALKTVEELYCLPKRSESDNDLQAVINEAMGKLEYCAPQSGDNQLVVQSADLDGDGTVEYLLFAKDNSEKPLKILIFCQLASGIVLMDTIEGYGFGFDFVSYEQVDDRPGVEIVVGRLVSEEVVRSVSVYRFSSGFSRHMLSAPYSRMSVADLNNDGICELYLLNRSATETECGSVITYAYNEEALKRVSEVPISTRAAAYKQMQVSLLDDGSSALYVTTEQDNNLVTDIFVHRNGALTELASGLISQSLRHDLVFPNDVDGDDILEMARLIPMYSQTDEKEWLLQWYSVNSNGDEAVKQHTYHNYVNNWYFEVDAAVCPYLTVERNVDACMFSVYDPQTDSARPMITITALRDADREDLAQKNGRIVLYSGDTVIYVADLLEAAESYGITEENVMRRFGLIRADLKTQED